MIIHKLMLWLKAARFETLIISLAPLALGALLASRQTQLDVLVLILTVLYALLAHMGTNLSNDYFDFINKVDNENRIAPFSTIQTFQTSLEAVRKAYKMCFFGAFLAGAAASYLISNVLAFFLTAAPLLAGYYYTGGKKPLGYIGLGEILVIIFFGPFCSLGTYFLQTKSISIVPSLAGLGPGFLSAAILSVNNLRDIYLDEKAGKNTMAVKRGTAFAVWESLFFIALSFFAFLLLGLIGEMKKMFIPLLILGSLFLPLKEIYSKDRMQMNAAIKKLVGVNVIYTLVLCYNFLKH